MTYVYISTEPNLWTVGFYHGDKWEPDSDHDSPEEAGERVRWLNGDGDENATLRRQLAELRTALEFGPGRMDGPAFLEYIACKLEGGKPFNSVLAAKDLRLKAKQARAALDRAGKEVTEHE